MIWSFYPAILGTTFSVLGLGWLSHEEHDPSVMRTLSELGALRKSTLRYFRFVLWVCGSLFALTVYFFIVPRLADKALVFACWSVSYVCEIMLGVFPADSGKSRRVHEIFSYTMAASMLLLGYIFVWIFWHNHPGLVLTAAGLMTACAIGGIADRGRFIFYELPFIFLSHLTIVFAAIFLR